MAEQLSIFGLWERVESAAVEELPPPPPPPPMPIDPRQVDLLTGAQPLRAALEEAAAESRTARSRRMAAPVWSIRRPSTRPSSPARRCSTSWTSPPISSSSLRCWYVPVLADLQAVLMLDDLALGAPPGATAPRRLAALLKAYRSARAAGTLDEAARIAAKRELLRLAPAGRALAQNLRRGEGTASEARAGVGLEGA